MKKIHYFDTLIIIILTFHMIFALFGAIIIIPSGVLSLSQIVEIINNLCISYLVIRLAWITEMDEHKK